MEPRKWSRWVRTSFRSAWRSLTRQSTVRTVHHESTINLITEQIPETAMEYKVKGSETRPIEHRSISMSIGLDGNDEPEDTDNEAGDWLLSSNNPATTFLLKLQEHTSNSLPKIVEELVEDLKMKMEKLEALQDATQELKERGENVRHVQDTRLAERALSLHQRLDGAKSVLAREVRNLVIMTIDNAVVHPQLNPNWSAVEEAKQMNERFELTVLRAREREMIMRNEIFLATGASVTSVTVSRSQADKKHLAD